MQRVPLSICSHCRVRSNLAAHLETRLFTRRYASLRPAHIAPSQALPIPPNPSWPPPSNAPRDRVPHGSKSKLRAKPKSAPTLSADQILDVLQSEVAFWSKAGNVRARLGRFGIPAKELRPLMNAFENDMYNGIAFDPATFSKDHMARFARDLSSPDKSSTLDSMLTSLFYAWASDPARGALVSPGTLHYVRTLRKSVDFSRLADAFPHARAIHRKVIMHVGPTNSGKTHNALRALAASSSGTYLGPLRLLAHEIYERLNTGQIVPLGADPENDPVIEPADDSNFDTDPSQARTIRKIGDPRYARACSLITGEESKLLENAALSSCTVEMFMPQRRYEVVVLDEIQMIADPFRGSAWTTAVLGACTNELHLCGEETAVPIIQALLADTGDELIINRHQRLSPLTIAETSLSSDLSQIRKGDCIVTFSRSHIFRLKEQVERVTGLRCAIAYGRLPPEIRTEQAALFNDPDSGYDVLIGSDAIGMGLNLKIKRVVFDALEKYDGSKVKPLSNSQVKQIGGRAGRFGLHGDGDQGGIVTTLNPDDLPRLRVAMDAPIQYITYARVGFGPGVFENILSALPPGASNMTALEVLQYVSWLTPTLEPVELGSNELAAAGFVDEFSEGLSMHDRGVFGNAPFPMRDLVCKECVGQMFKLFRDQGRVDLRRVLESTDLLEDLNDVLKMMNAKTGEPVSTNVLGRLETLHRVLSTYNWLYVQRPVAFFAKDQATALKESVERAMEYSLRTNAANRTTPVVSKKLVKSRVELRTMGRKRT